MNSCICIGSIAWLSQFFGNTREADICRLDNTARRLAPTHLMLLALLCLLSSITS
eukprot:m.128296 g.128296  ORF g.128296 m.128296 type:complete len:55 (+) comp37952_c0_seq5:200-364(+)